MVEEEYFFRNKLEKSRNFNLTLILVSNMAYLSVDSMNGVEFT